MTDLQTAKSNLSGCTLVLCKDGKIISSASKGIAPIMNLIAENIDLNSYSAADLIVGKAVAMLFVRCGIKAVYAQTLSMQGKAVLEKYKIPYEYDVLTKFIVNRAGTDVCPMEKTVTNTEDLDEAYSLLKAKVKELRQQNDS